jgi:hypothetical protein
LRAAEQDRPDVAQAREAWKANLAENRRSRLQGIEITDCSQARENCAASADRMVVALVRRNQSPGE